MVVTNGETNIQQIVQVNPGVCQDGTGNGNTSGHKEITIDREAPTVTVTADTANVTNATSIMYTFEFSETVVGFDESDITVTNGTKGTFTAVDENTYTLVVTNGETNIQQIVQVNSGVCQDGTGNGNVDGYKEITIVEVIFNGTHNVPKLAAGMTPVIFEESDFTDATSSQITNASWYKYNGDIGTGENETSVDRELEEKWANIKLLDGSIFVWIPRYTYKINNTYQNEHIWIKYSNGTTDDTSDGFKVHPAFTFGSTQLTGIWVAKFEASNNEGKIQVKPGQVSWASLMPYEMFNKCRAMELENSAIYGITNADAIDTHMMKNSEWGAVSYITEAIRDGVEVTANNNTDRYAGGSVTLANVYTINKAQSTTGNAYGIYDLNGGLGECVASYISNGEGTLTTNGNSLIYSSTKYRDELTGSFNGEAINAYDQTILQTEGMALHEISIFNQDDATLNSFRDYGDMKVFPFGITPFFIRGSYYTNSVYSGIFAYMNYNGTSHNYVSFRPVISVTTVEQ